MQVDTLRSLLVSCRSTLHRGATVHQGLRVAEISGDPLAPADRLLRSREFAHDLPEGVGDVGTADARGRRCSRQWRDGYTLRRLSASFLFGVIFVYMHYLSSMHKQKDSGRRGEVSMVEEGDPFKNSSVSASLAQQGLLLWSVEILQNNAMRCYCVQLQWSWISCCRFEDVVYIGAIIFCVYGEREFQFDFERDGDSLKQRKKCRSRSSLPPRPSRSSSPHEICFLYHSNSFGFSGVRISLSAPQHHPAPRDRSGSFCLREVRLQNPHRSVVSIVHPGGWVNILFPPSGVP